MYGLKFQISVTQNLCFEDLKKIYRYQQKNLTSGLYYKSYIDVTGFGSSIYPLSKCISVLHELSCSDVFQSLADNSILLQLLAS
jgi:hypothetical protein